MDECKPLATGHGGAAGGRGWAPNERPRAIASFPRGSARWRGSAHLPVGYYRSIAYARRSAGSRERVVVDAAAAAANPTAADPTTAAAAVGRRR